MVDKKKRFGVALRLSTEDEAKKKGEVGSLESQRQRTTDYAERDGGEVVRTYEEDGVSGGLEGMQRPAIVEMLTDAEAGLLDAVVWDKADRQGRSVVEVSLIEARLAEFGVEVHTVEGGRRERQTSAGILTEGIKDLVAESERFRIKERMADGRIRAAREGKWVGGMPPLGYVVGEDGRLAVHKGEAAVVKSMFEAVASGLSAREAAVAVSKEFDRRKLPKRKGGKGWGNQHVYDALKRQAYYGAGFARFIADRPVPKHLASCDHEDAADDGCGTCGRRRVVVPAPAIVSADLWTKANESLKARRKNTKHKTADEFERHEYAFGKRVVHVHEDGSEFTMYGITRKRSNTKGERWKERAYRCTASAPRRGRFGDDDPDKCGGFGVTSKGHRRTSIFADKTEASFLVEMLEKLQDRETFEKWLRFEDAKGLSDKDREGFLARTPEDRIVEADAKLAALAEEKNRIRRMERKGRYSEDEADAAWNEVEVEEAKLAAIKLRAAEDQKRDAVRDFTIETLLGMKVGPEVFHPGREREVFTDPEEGFEVLEVPAWTDVAKWLYDEAMKVFRGETRELSERAVQWAGRLAEVFDVRLRVFDVGDKLPRIEAAGSVKLGAIGETPPDPRRRGA